jgi:hypothetical protein
VRLPSTAFLLALAVTARSDVTPVGPELQVNTYTTGYQSGPAVAADAAGRFVVVWQSQTYPSQDGSGAGVFAQRFDTAGTAVGAEFQVNTYTTGFQFLPAVAARGSGGFVAAWGSGYDFAPGQDGSAGGAFVQRYDASGAPLGGELQANTYTTATQTNPAVAVDPAGNFVVVWMSGGYFIGSGQDGSAAGVFGQRYDATGARLGQEFRANTYTTGLQGPPDVAVDGAGNFVVVWQSGSYATTQDGSRSGVFGRRFSSAGAPVGAEFQVNTYTTGSQSSPRVAAGAAGGFVVVWQGYGLPPGQDGSGGGVFGQRFDGAGTRVGAEFRVNTYTTGGQGGPAVAAGASGDFLVAWHSFSSQDGSGSGVFGQHFSPAGDALGPEFQVNAYTPGPQSDPAVTADAAGRFVVAWRGGGYYGGGDGSGPGVFARRFATIALGPPLVLPGGRLTLRADPATPGRQLLSARTADPAITLGAGNGSIDDPTLGGGHVRVRSDVFDDTYDLPAAGWRHIGAPGASLGYVYRDPVGPIRYVRVKTGTLVKAIGRGAGLGHSLATNPDPVTVVVQTGAAGQRYCMTFGGAVSFRPDRTYRAKAAPAACPP